MSDICKKCGQLITDHSYGQCPGTIGSAAAILGSKGGSATSEDKARAVRENGKLGGRPVIIVAEFWSSGKKRTWRRKTGESFADFQSRIIASGVSISGRSCQDGSVMSAEFDGVRGELRYRP